MEELGDAASRDVSIGGIRFTGDIRLGVAGMHARSVQGPVEARGNGLVRRVERAGRRSRGIRGAAASWVASRRDRGTQSSRHKLYAHRGLRFRREGFQIQTYAMGADSTRRA